MRVRSWSLPAAGVVAAATLFAVGCGTTPPPTDTVEFARGTSAPTLPIVPVVVGVALLALAWFVRRAGRPA